MEETLISDLRKLTKSENLSYLVISGRIYDYQVIINKDLNLYFNKIPCEFSQSRQKLFLGAKT